MGPQAYPAAVILGMGQASAILAAMALVGMAAVAVAGESRWAGGRKRRTQSR